MRADGFYWVRYSPDFPGNEPTVGRWDGVNEWWDAIGFVECRPNESFEVLSGPIAPPEVKP